MSFPKNKPIRDKARLNSVRSLPCCACRSEWGVDAHHIIGTKEGGMGMKVGDDKTIPLCRVCHTELHLMGHKTWESINGEQEIHLEDTNRKLERRKGWGV